MGATAKGLDGIIKAAEERAARARDLSPALRVAAEAVKLAIDDSFRSRSDFAGVAFAPNRPSTIKRKGSSVPDIDTGRFRSSIFAAPFGKSAIRFGTNVPYAEPVIAGFVRSGTLKHNAYSGGQGKLSAPKVTQRRLAGESAYDAENRIRGELAARSEHRRLARGGRTALAGPRQMRAAGSAYQFGAPPRNPFPVSPLGRWLGTQRASALLTKVGRTVSDYVMRGRL